MSPPFFLFEVLEAAAVAGVGQIGDGQVLERSDGRQLLQSPGVACLQFSERLQTCSRQ